MEWQNITKTQNEDAWLSDYIANVLVTEPTPLPPHDGKIGHVETHWHQVGPGQVYVAANPQQGTPADRAFACSLIVRQLHNCGFKQASYDLTKESGWASEKVEAKAQRLVQTGAVTLDRNSPEIVLAHVRGDGTDNDGVPDVHQVEIHKIRNANNPAGGQGAIASMHCDCDWGTFMNQNRTRRWKDFQYTPCSHVIATYWSSLSVPTDESRAPGDFEQPGQMMLPSMPSGGQPAPSMGLMQQSPYPSPNAWFMQPGAPPNAFNQGPQMGGGGPTGGPTQAPAPEDVLPQFPMDQSLMPQVNPASTPGGRPGPTPTNPLQYPGGTFSSVHTAEQQYQNGDLVRLKQPTQGQYEGRPESGMAGQAADIPAGAVCEVLGTDPITGLINVLWMGKGLDQMSYFEPFGITCWVWPSEVSPAQGPGPMVRRR